jgi:hypothetical protein
VEQRRVEHVECRPELREPARVNSGCHQEKSARRSQRERVSRGEANAAPASRSSERRGRPKAASTRDADAARAMNYLPVVLLDELAPPDGAIDELDDVPPLGDGDAPDMLDDPDGVVEEELLVDGPLMELVPDVDGLDVLLVSVLVDDEELDAGGVAGIAVVDDELDDAGGGVTVVLLVSLRSQAARPRARATATALDNTILEFM